MQQKQPYLQVVNNQAQQERILWGYQLPYLPDGLADHTLLGQNDQERVMEILNRWVQFVLGLRKWQGSAYALRFLAQPDAGAIQVSLLGRYVAGRGQGQGMGEQVAADLAAQLIAYGLVGESMDKPTLQKTLVPFQTATHIIEVRQHEEVTPFLVTQGEAYVTHPFWSPGGSWLIPFETMLRQSVPVAVSLYIEPTNLYDDERESLLRAAQIAQTLADQQVRVMSEASMARRRDPQAELIGRIYATLLAQLTEPFLTMVQVASGDHAAAWTVARSFGSAITLGQSSLTVESHERALPTNFDIRYPRTEAETQAAWHGFTQLTLTPWGNELASNDKKRLVYLVGAKGAAAAFRLPISVRGGVPGIATKQNAPDFEPGPRPVAAATDELQIGHFRRGGAATVKLKHLTRHALITGFTGAGKTNTVLYLLNQLWHKHRIPFLVIEAAKKEYRGLLNQPGFEDLLVFTLGDETTSPFRLNPFELLPGVRLEAHLGYLQNCFDAALPQFGILPSIVAESLEEVYRDKQWQMTDRGVSQPDRLFPTLRDMLGKVVKIVESRGYAGETYHNIRAAAAGRIGNLLRGSRGRMLDCQRSIPMSILMNRPVVLELNDLNQQDKALVMMFLLMLLREYREQNKGKNLQHVTVVEEAHNVMENVKSVGASEVAADTRAKAVEAFAAMLAEVRAYGEGIIISDQSPDKLAPDAVRNTNLQIAHQLRHRVDREAIAAAMLMTEAQQEYLGKLQTGEAALFQTGYDRATFIQVPNYKDEAGFGEPTDDQVTGHMSHFRQQYLTTYLPFDGCRFCNSPCQYRSTVEPYTRIPELVEDFQRAVKQFDERPQAEYWPENWRQVAQACHKATQEVIPVGQIDGAWCYLAHEIDFPFTAHMRQEFVKAYSEVVRG
ncbi:MAG: ATP-binding protein [Chloroflexi bacterium]|nr:ATP-binding protein [Chloroflexota bacterium]